MALRDRRLERGSEEQRRLYRKASQEWDLAGMARQDGDTAAEQRHTAQAREYESQARDMGV